MNLKQQVTSLELAKEAKKNGIEMSTNKYWVQDCPNIEGDGAWDLFCQQYFISEEDLRKEHKHIPAPTATELLELLPDNIIEKDKGLRFVLEKDPDYWVAHYFDSTSGLSMYARTADSPADALAKLAIKLKEEDLT